MKAVCVRCGFDKPSFDAVCPDCGHRPEGDGLLVAWLLSDHHLDAPALQASSTRIKAGEPIRPSRKMLRKAQRALGRRVSTDPGLSLREIALLFAGDVVFTPLIGWTCVAWWYGERPRAALQAGLVTLPTSLAFTALWGWFAFGGAA
jgi:hypothetical protein